jgi:hypothetical protein
VKRPIQTIVLAALSLAVAISSLVVTLQFLEVIPWGDEDLDFWGGKWAGVLLFGAEAAIALLVAYGWLTLKPWAFTITLLMALAGISVPLMSLAAGTETWSTALLPILINAAVIAMVLSKDVRHATSPDVVPDSV